MKEEEWIPGLIYFWIFLLSKSGRQLKDGLLFSGFSILFIHLVRKTKIYLNKIKKNKLEFRRNSNSFIQFELDEMSHSRLSECFWIIQTCYQYWKINDKMKKWNKIESDTHASILIFFFVSIDTRISICTEN